MTQNNIKIAITGGMGSGKSTVSKIIAEEGLPVYSCDKIYSGLLTDKPFLETLSKEFGGALNSDGSLDRKVLSEIVFNDSNKLKKLNSITHPAIMKEALTLMQGQVLSFCEVPLLFENAFEKFFDGVIVVLRDREQRINSITERDGISRENAILRINSQYNYENGDFTKYYVIHNDGSIDDLKQKILKIITEIKSNKFIKK